MRQLHLVGITSDHEGLILAGRRGAKSGDYVVTLDADLLEQIDTARRIRRGQPAGEAAPSGPGIRSRVESALSPREMQVRLRSGRSVAEVAAEAGVSEEWVDRFAAPVLAEQASAVEKAGHSVLKTPRRGLSDRPLNSSVMRNLADKAVRLPDDEFVGGWSACHVMDSEWLIRFQFYWRGRVQKAEWTFDVGAGTLVSRNRMGTELGFVDPERQAPFSRELPPIRLRTPTGSWDDDSAADDDPEGPDRRRRPAKRGGSRTSAGARKTAAPRKQAGTKKAVATRRAASVTKAVATRKAAATKRAAATKKAVATKKTVSGSAQATPARRVSSPRQASALAAPPGAKRGRPAQSAGAPRKASPTRQPPAALAPAGPAKAVTIGSPSTPGRAPVVAAKVVGTRRAGRPKPPAVTAQIAGPGDDAGSDGADSLSSPAAGTNKARAIRRVTPTPALPIAPAPEPQAETSWAQSNQTNGHSSRPGPESNGLGSAPSTLGGSSFRLARPLPDERSEVRRPLRSSELAREAAARRAEEGEEQRRRPRPLRARPLDSTSSASGGPMIPAERASAPYPATADTPERRPGGGT